MLTHLNWHANKSKVKDSFIYCEDVVGAIDGEDSVVWTDDDSSENDEVEI